MSLATARLWGAEGPVLRGHEYYVRARWSCLTVVS
jgi:hypothetical protein